MNNTRLHAIEEGQTGIAKKVLAAVPIAEAWQFHQIAAEISRATGSRIEKRLISGCLMTLKEAGLVRETAPGGWRQRVAPKVKPPTTHSKPDEGVDVPAFQRDFDAKTPFDRLGHIADTLRDIADEIDKAALDMQQQVESASAGSGKLLQLKELLKSI